MARRKGSSKAGRPKTKGARYPSGKLKPKGPSELVLAKRKAGDASAGEHPLDFALSRQWITEQQHRDAAAYRDVFNHAHIGGPKMSHGGLCEVIPSEELRMNWSQLADAEITEIFDKVFNSIAAPIDHERAAAGALARWRLLNAGLTPSEREELFRVCVLGSWPFWMPKKAADHALGSADLAKEGRLLDALTAVGRVMRPDRRRAAKITPLPFKRSRAGRTEVAVRYETEAGAEVEPESQRGQPFEVSILRKRA